VDEQQTLPDPATQQQELAAAREEVLRLREVVRQLVVTEQELHTTNLRIDAQARLHRRLAEVAVQLVEVRELLDLARLAVRFAVYDLGFEAAFFIGTAPGGEGLHILAADGPQDEATLAGYGALTFSVRLLLPVAGVQRRLLYPQPRAPREVTGLARTLGLAELVLLRLDTAAPGVAACLVVGNSTIGSDLFSPVQPHTVPVEGLAQLAGQLSAALRAVQAFRSLMDQHRLLAESEARFRTLFDSINDALFVYDAVTGDVVDVNRRVTEVYGYTKEEAVLLSAGDLSSGLPPCDRAEALRRLSLALSEGPQLFEWTARDKQGRCFPVEVSMKRARLGQAERILASIRDIAERKRLEQELLKTRNLESLGVLAGGIAHDFNNLFSVLLGNVSLAREKLAPGHPVQPLLEAGLHVIDRAQGLSNQMLTFARGGVPLKRSLSLEQLVRESAGFVLHGANVRLEIHAEPGLPLVEADPAQLSQVVQNLVLNADQAMPAGGVVEIGLHALGAAAPRSRELPSGPLLCITVTDEGVGIPAELLPRLFDPFFTTKPTGHGLGLSSVYSIVKRHGGAVQVASVPGQGSTFTVWLPAASPEARVESPATVDDHGPAGASGSRARILLMDDEELLRQVAAAMIGHLGHQVVLCKDGHEALHLYREARQAGNPFQLVILDMTVPGGLGGREAAAAMLQEDPGARIVVSSGYSVDPWMVRPDHHGLAGVLPKPYDFGSLSRLLAGLLPPPP
jgi:PAS domain S-box-containing protein